MTLILTIYRKNKIYMVWGYKKRKPPHQFHSGVAVFLFHYNTCTSTPMGSSRRTITERLRTCGPRFLTRTRFRFGRRAFFNPRKNLFLVLRAFLTQGLLRWADQIKSRRKLNLSIQWMVLRLAQPKGSDSRYGPLFHHS
mgnify:CR=1 FL=1